MASVKRKKPEKGYTYHEYVQKFRPKLLPKEEHRADDAYNHPLLPLCRPVLDDIDEAIAQAESDPQDCQ
jgi:hypothetical protein